MKEDLSHYNAPGTQLRAAQLRMLEILNEIDKICKKYNITYWLDGGTLLGCVRHKGFIPWDDDLDIAVYEEDYERLLAILQKELPEQYRVEWPGNNKNFSFNIAKVVDSKSYVEQTADTWTPRAGITGLWVDIFPMIHGNRPIRKMVEPLYGRCFRHSRNLEGIWYKRVLAYMLYPLAILLVGLAKIACLFISKDKFVNRYGTGSAKAQHSTRHRSWVVPTIDMQFENGVYPVPFNYDAYLTTIYGDYMKIPSAENRIVHLGEIKVF